MLNNVVLNNALRNTLTSINRTQETIDKVSSRLATGQKVSSAIDQPQNFFSSKGLLHRASDFNRLLDGLSQSTKTIEESLIGVEALTSLLNQGEAIAIESQQKLITGETDPAVEEVIISSFPTPLSTLIQASNPVAYWRLDDAGSPAVNLGSTGAAVNGTYAGGVTNQAPALYINDGQPSADFDGVNDIVNIPDSAQINTTTTTARTVELVFNADTTAGRQVLYEEGAQVNGFTIYIDNGAVYVTGEDDQGAQRWFDANISAPIIAGQTYHVAFVYSAATDSFTGYLDGVNIGSVGTAGSPSFPSHSGNIGIGGAPDGVQFHDGESNSGGFRYNGRISDVAVYNTALSAGELSTRAQSLNPSTSVEYRHTDFENILAQIDNTILDANYRGVNLLAEDDLITDFNEDRTNRLETEGVDFSFKGLGIIRNDFNNIDDLDDVIDSVRDAIKTVRDFGSSLVNDLAIINTRTNFTRSLINNHTSGADDLTVADLNEEGVNQLAAQTRLDIGFTALVLISQSQATILDLFTGRG